MSSLTPDQLQTITTWAAEGANLNQIQDRLRTEFAITLTYMEARLLVLELGLKLQDKPRENLPRRSWKHRPRLPRASFRIPSMSKPQPARAPQAH